MAKYFIDDEIYYKNEKLPPTKVKLTLIKPIDDNRVMAYDNDGDGYILNKKEIFDDGVDE